MLALLQSFQAYLKLVKYSSEIHYITKPSIVKITKKKKIILFFVLNMVMSMTFNKFIEYPFENGF